MHTANGRSQLVKCGKKRISQYDVSQIFTQLKRQFETFFEDNIKAKEEIPNSRNLRKVTSKTNNNAINKLIILQDDR